MRIKLLVIGIALAIGIGFAVYLVIDQGLYVAGSKTTAPAIPAHLADQASVHDSISVSNAFACDLYHQLARMDNAGNIFFSPYSIAGALTLLAEGAQGETVDQLGRAMHYPANLRQKGPEARLSPWDSGHINAGLAEFNRELCGVYRPSPTDIRVKIEALRNKVADTNKRIQDLGSRGNYQESDDLAVKAQSDADELNRLLSLVDQYELQVANTVWAEQTYPLNQIYIDKMHQLYGSATIIPADFIHDPESMRHRINNKIEEQTHGQIKGMLAKGSINKMTRLALINAIYFKGEWQEIFQKEQTKNNVFHLLNGTKSTVSMMQNTFESVGYAAFNGNGTLFQTPKQVAYEGIRNEKMLYPDNKGFMALELTYKGGGISMIVLLPRSNSGFATLEKNLTLKNAEKWIGALQKREVEVYLPKFSLRTSYELKQPLKSLGITRVFKNPRYPGGAELGAFCASQDPNRRLFITDALHNAYLEVNEEGTEAAAVTIFAPEAAAALPEMVPFTPVFRADKPFLFLIRHRKTNAILFMGRVVVPIVEE